MITDTSVELRQPSTELSRRTEPIAPTGSIFATPERTLNELLGPDPTAPPQALMPGSPQNTLMPPNSFDSANSHANQSYYGHRPESPPGLAAPVTGVSATQSTERAENPHRVFTIPELSDQLILVSFSNEEMLKVVQALQVSVNNLEIQVADLQLNIQWYDDNWPANNS